MDAAPLITLAAAQSLDYVLYPELPVLIPDAVFMRRRRGPASSARKRSLIGTVPIWERSGSSPPRPFNAKRGLSDDRDAERLSVTDAERLILLSTWDDLRQLEEAQRIQSADAVIDAGRAAGRTPTARDLCKDHDPLIEEDPRPLRLDVAMNGSELVPSFVDGELPFEDSHSVAETAIVSGRTSNEAAFLSPPKTS